MNMDVNGCTTTRRLTGTTLKQVGIIPCMATQKRCKEEFAIHSDEDFTHYSSILFGSYFVNPVTSYVFYHHLARIT
jgi:hypothetical protein